MSNPIAKVLIIQLISLIFSTNFLIISNGELTPKYDSIIVGDYYLVAISVTIPITLIGYVIALGLNVISGITIESKCAVSSCITCSFLMAAGLSFLTTILSVGFYLTYRSQV